MDGFAELISFGLISAFVCSTFEVVDETMFETACFATLKVDFELEMCASDLTLTFAVEASCGLAALTVSFPFSGNSDLTEFSLALTVLLSTGFDFISAEIGDLTSVLKEFSTFAFETSVLASVFVGVLTELISTLALDGLAGLISFVFTSAFSCSPFDDNEETTVFETLSLERTSFGALTDFESTGVFTFLTETSGSLPIATDFSAFGFTSWFSIKPFFCETLFPTFEIETFCPFSDALESELDTRGLVSISGSSDSKASNEYASNDLITGLFKVF